jgi:hypothetical protein
VKFYGFSGRTYDVALYAVGTPTALATATSSELGASGITTVSFSGAVALTPGTQYIVAIYDKDNTHYPLVSNATVLCPIARGEANLFSASGGGVWQFNSQIWCLSACTWIGSEALPNEEATSEWYPIEPVITT